MVSTLCTGICIVALTFVVTIVLGMIFDHDPHSDKSPTMWPLWSYVIACFGFGCCLTILLFQYGIIK